MILNVTLHEAPHVGYIGASDPTRGVSQFLGMPGFCHDDLHVNFASSKHPPFGGQGGEGVSQHNSRIPCLFGSRYRT